MCELKHGLHSIVEAYKLRLGATIVLVQILQMFSSDIRLREAFKNVLAEFVR